MEVQEERVWWGLSFLLLVLCFGFGISKHPLKFMLGLFPIFFLMGELLFYEMFTLHTSQLF